MSETEEAIRNCIRCGEKLPKHRTKMRKFCSETCRVEYHSSKRMYEASARTGANALASQGPAIQAAWTDLHDLVKKHGKLFQTILDGQ